MAASISRRNRAAESAERRRCPICHRKSALKVEVHEGQVVSYCRWDDCGYENATDTIEWDVCTCGHHHDPDRPCAPECGCRP